jgi:hypothetical protein
MIMEENVEKSKLIKEALIIVDELGKCTFNDEDDLIKVQDRLKTLARKAKQLKNNRYWKL